MIHENLAERLGKLLRKRRRELRISQRVLADFAGVNQSVVCRVERGDDALMSTWQKLFDGLGERVEFISTRSCEEGADILKDENDERRERRLLGLMARFG